MHNGDVINIVTTRNEVLNSIGPNSLDINTTHRTESQKPTIEGLRCIRKSRQVQ